MKNGLSEIGRGFAVAAALGCAGVQKPHEAQVRAQCEEVRQKAFQAAASQSDLPITRGTLRMYADTARQSEVQCLVENRVGPEGSVEPTIEGPGIWVKQ